MIINFLIHNLCYNITISELPPPKGGGLLKLRSVHPSLEEWLVPSNKRFLIPKKIFALFSLKEKIVLF